MLHWYSSLSKEELLKQKDICKGIGLPCPDIDAELKQREQEELLDKREEITLSNARIARSEARKERIIQISAIILSIATAIGIAIFQWLTKK